jgi:hypothetical protein
MDHLDNQNILNENQHGFRAKRPCESQLLMTTNDITKWMNNNIQVDIAILDFAKASLMNTRNNVGPSTVPWGTPDVT